MALRPWRVRVNRAVEDWVELSAETCEQAERAAAALPGVIGVFGRSAIPADKPVDKVFVGVEEE